MLSLPHYSGSSLPWPTFIILSLEGLYLLQCKLAVIVYHSVEYLVCVSKIKTACLCVCLWQRHCWQHWFTRASGTCFSHLFFWGPSPLRLSPLVTTPDSPAGVCVFFGFFYVCVCPCLAVCWSRSAYTSFSAGISLLVPHGGIAEDTTWEMYMIINQEDSRWGTLSEPGAVCFSGCSLLISQPVAWHLSSPPPATSSPPLFLENKHAHGFLTCAVRIHVPPWRGQIPTQHGILAHLAATAGEDICVTNALAAADRLRYCLKQLSQQRKETLLDSAGLFCVCRRNCDNISLHHDWWEWWKLCSHDDRRYWFGFWFNRDVICHKV